MTLNEYQQHVLRTSNPNVDGRWTAAMANWALGLTGEAGEFADKVKKVVFHGHPLDSDTEIAMAKELGDCLWYVARAAHTLGYTLDQIAEMNVEKLRQRYPNGWTREDSIARVDELAEEPPADGKEDY